MLEEFNTMGGFSGTTHTERVKKIIGENTTQHLQGKTYYQIYGNRAEEEIQKRKVSIIHTRTTKTSRGKSSRAAQKQWERQKQDKEFMKNFVKKVGVVGWWSRATEEQKEAAKQKMRGRVQTKAERKRRSIVRRRVLKNIPDLHPNRLCAKQGKISSLEKRVMRYLKSLGYLEEEDFISNYPLKTSKHSNSYLDIAFLSRKLDIECDGTYWHQDKERDTERDKKIKRAGWKTVRVSEVEIYNGKYKNIIKSAIESKSEEYKKLA